MPKAMVRLSAGRQEMSEAMQALCFFAGANSIFYGEKLLTTGNPEVERDQALFAKLGSAAAGNEGVIHRPRISAECRSPLSPPSLRISMHAA